MTGWAPKAELLRYLQAGREALLWKTEGLGEYDLRRPMTPTGTNLLGLVKHVAACEMGYLGAVFGRPADEPQPWFAEDADPQADLFATADESPADVVALYRRVWAHSDATVEALELDAVGRVPWWAEGGQEITLHRALVHMIAETHRHAGHADILRERIDGTAGLRDGNDNMPPGDETHRREYHDRLETLAREAGGR
ncbi:uncharacterized protein DUF664 [Pseudonocardia sediminis]|uniref:Uncharacterized protein DUF664 n=1 Tax=Pseudonocardia sediminis TaxID=1397368 RepID=A0A4Q7UYU8_PSEST|nr:DinB family protein [Pseudonocardia sediminis]RZT86304.1 uncharacterized protein DUF664 [Pseudonocardia sediminis]